MLLIGLVSDSPRTGFAVGGFLVIFGLTSLINSLFESRAPFTRSIRRPNTSVRKPRIPIDTLPDSISIQVETPINRMTGGARILR